MIKKSSEWIGQYGFLILQLAVIGGFIHHFNIEVQFNLPLLFPFVIGAFLIHSALPFRLRTTFFILSAIGGLFILLPFKEVLILLGLTMLMLGICNLKISLGFRKVLLLLVAIALALMRMGIFTNWIASQTLVLFGSMFMFRMLLFLYELKYQKEAVPFQTQLSYFLMLPNLIFPLFPVVDFKLFQRNYYNTTDTEIYQRGVSLISKGIFHMFLYRIIYSFLVPTVSEVQTLSDFIQYLVFSYLLVIRLSGLFHFSVGVLCLFGYNLPEIFKNIFLASGFADLWRRLNIYWKDFMIKMFFNPIYFRFKKYGTKQAIFWSTLICFGITLLLHSYQTFWLVGVFNVSNQDLIFWLLFGLLVAFGGLFNWNKTSQNSSYKSVIHVGKVLITFTSMALIWSFWNTNNMSSWLKMIGTVQTASKSAIVLGLFTMLAFVIITGVIIDSSFFKKLWNSRRTKLLELRVPLLALFFLILSFNSWTLKNYWDDRIDGNDIHFLFNFIMKKSDTQNEIAGYYDNILATSDLMSPLAADLVSRSSAFNINLYQRNILFQSDDAFKRKFTPSSKTTIQGIKVEINRWGMHDKDYELIPDDSTFRIAVLGGSIEMGWAIPTDQGLDKVIEGQLNSDSSLKSRYKQFEVLNFSVPSRNILNQSYALKHQVMAFKPQMVIFFDHDETEWVNIVNSLQEYDYSQDFEGYVDSLYLTPGLITAEANTNELIDRLESRRQPLIKSIYADIAEMCKANDISPVVVAMPELRAAVYKRNYNHPEIAEGLGLKLIDLSSMFDIEKVASYSMDRVGHPTPEANELIIKALYTQLSEYLATKFENY